MSTKTTATLNTIIVPEVFAQMTTEKVEGNIKLSALADIIGTLSNSKEGDSITFPQFLSLSEAQLVTKGVPIDVEELNQKESKKEVKHISTKATRIYDEDNIESLGRFSDNAVEQHSKILARGLDYELAEDIKANAVLKSATAQADSLSEDELIAGFQLFGDEQDNDDISGILVNSRLAPSFYRMDGFVKSDITYTNPINGRIINGCIGYYRGSIPIFMSNVNTFDTTKNECITYIVKKHSLGIIPKTGIKTAFDREEKYFATDVISHEWFACGLIDKTGVVLLKKTIA